MKKILYSSALLLLGNEIISLAVLAVLMSAGLVWLLKAAAEGGVI